MLSKESWDTIGSMDERFTENGAEDNAFRNLSRHKLGMEKRIPGTLLHLYHPRSGIKHPRSNQRIYKSEYRGLKAKRPDPYSTHLDTLNRLFDEHQINSVFEYGCGTYSTSLFAEKADEVWAVEMQKKAWFDKIRRQFTGEDSVNISWRPGGHWDDEYDAIDFMLSMDRRFDLVFVDGVTGSRYKAINAAAQVTDIIVTHDTENPTYRWDLVDLKEEEWETWTDKRYRPWTTVWQRRITP